jgi:threonine dehydrogenase-like Zn-dependent dehydrogenase
MRAFRMHGVGEATMDDVAEPELAPGDLLLEPVVCGVCATDVHVLYEGALVTDLPLTMGHEVIGRVVERRRGGDASPYRPGQRQPEVGDLVSVEPLFPCGSCAQCARGLPNLCNRSTHLGISADGCFADLVRVPAARSYPVPDGLDPTCATFVEPFACGLHFVDKARLGPGRTAVVLGGGPAGLLTLQAATLAGAAVIVSEPYEPRRKLALSLGATAAVDPSDLAAAIADGTAGRGADAIIEVTGSPDAVTQAVEVAAPGSTVVLTGVCGGPGPTIDTNAIVTRELTLSGAVASRWHFDRATAIIAAGRVATASMTSIVGSFTEVGSLLALARDDRDVCKILVDHR